MYYQNEDNEILTVMGTEKNKQQKASYFIFNPTLLCFCTSSYSCTFLTPTCSNQMYLPSPVRTKVFPDLEG